MPKISRSALLEVPVALAYGVVMDVEAYPQFLPGCDAVKVLQRLEDGLHAEVSVTGLGMTQTFVTANKHQAETITMNLVRGPLKALAGEWHFSEIGDRGCRVQVNLAFEVDGMLGGMLIPIADRVANKLVDAFCERIEDVHKHGIGGKSAS